jgi:hypothetical protein
MVEGYRKAREQLQFLDCNMWIGRPTASPLVPRFVTEYNLASLQKWMERYRIRGGIVSHFASKDYDPVAGNEMLLNALAGTNLWAGIVLVPEMFESEKVGNNYLADVVARGARLVRLFPLTHRFTLHAWCSGALLSALEAWHLPLTLWHTETSWDMIRSICISYPDLTVIIEGTPQKILYHTRFFYPLLGECPNLRLELHNFSLFLSVEDVVARFGANRLIYGSYMPIFDPNASMMQVTHARISVEEKRRIAHKNLAEMIAGVKEP